MTNLKTLKMNKYMSWLGALIILMLSAATASAQRKITPVNTPATATQAVNEFEGDTARIHARMRATMQHYHDENGNVIYIDTVTGREWVDSAAIIIRRKPMQYPLLHSWSVSIDAWNPLMRVFGQKYGLIDFQGQIDLHNRYRPTVEMGIGHASDTPADNNFTYKSPLSWYMRLGVDYNFLYNNTPDYQFVAGLRYGIAPFSYSITDISIESPYWGNIAHPHIPSQKAFVGWFEFCLGLRVKLSGPISAGWLFRFHGILHENKHTYGSPWYIPGYGTRNGRIGGSIYVTYSFDFAKKKQSDTEEPNPDYIPESVLRLANDLENVTPSPTSDNPDPEPSEPTPGFSESDTEP